MFPRSIVVWNLEQETQRSQLFPAIKVTQLNHVCCVSCVQSCTLYLLGLSSCDTIEGAEKTSIWEGCITFALSLCLRLVSHRCNVCVIHWIPLSELRTRGNLDPHPLPESLGNTEAFTLSRHMCKKWSLTVRPINGLCHYSPQTEDASACVSPFQLAWALQ